MKETVSFCSFCDAFRGHGREKSFTYEGFVALFDYLEQLEEGQGEEMELDVVALDCEYTEYKTIEDIENATTVIRIDDDSFIIAQF